MTSAIEPHIGIIGTGIAGLALAYRLVKEGFRPTLIEGDERAASRCAQGVVANKGLIFFESPLFAAKLRSLSHVQTWLSELESVSGLQIARNFSGVWEPYWGPEDFSRIVSRIYRHRFWGCHRTQNLKSAGPSWAFGGRKPLGHLFYPADGWFDVEACLRALEAILQKAGVPTLLAKVNQISVSPGGSLRCLGKDFDATFDQLVLATGAGTDSLFKASNIELPKIFKIGGQTLAVPIAAFTEQPLTGVRQTLSGSWYRDQLLLGSSSWKGEDIDEAGVGSDKKLLISAIESQLGWDLKPYHKGAISRVGTRLRFADRMPAIGSIPFDPWRGKLFLMCGFYKSGLQLADLCARDLCLHLRGRSEEVEYPAFDPARLFKSLS